MGILNSKYCSLKSYLYFLIPLLFMQFFFGCTKIIDTLPPGTPKGFVEFSLECKSGLAAVPLFVDTGRGWSEHIGFLKHLRKLRIAKTPGVYSFSVKYGTADKDFVVHVKEGMLTPVKIVYKEHSYREYRYIKTGGREVTIYFDLQTFPDEPRPIKTND